MGLLLAPRRILKVPASSLGPETGYREGCRDVCQQAHANSEILNRISSSLLPPISFSMTNGQSVSF